MAETLRITKDQPFAFYVPLVILNADGSKEEVVASSLANVSVSVTSVHGEFTPEHDPHDHYLILRIPATLKVGDHAVIVTADLASGRQFSLRIKRAFVIVDWDFQSNWKDYLVGDHIELTDQPFIAGTYSTDAEYEALKATLVTKIAEAEALKAEWQRQLNNINGVATKADVESAKGEILAALASIDTYVELSDAELDGVFDDEDPEAEEEPHAAPQDPSREYTRQRIEAYNANLDVRVNLRRTNVDSGMATWEDEEHNEWYTDYPYALGDAVWNSNPATSQAWGVISLISE